MFGLALSSMAQKAPTFDEQGFIVRGLAYLRGHTQIRVGHPLGLNALNAALLAGDEAVNLPVDDPSWGGTSFHRPGELFLWEIGNDKGRGFFDVKAVMNHEQGHALSQAHFGSISYVASCKVIWTPKDGDNVMLAAISSNTLFEGFQGTDIGGPRSSWSTWPIQ